MNALLIALLAVAVWAWVDALRAREAALRACRRVCERHELQLLDETVALKRLRLGRGTDGRVRLRRHYGFEYSERGDERRQGEAVLLGWRIESVRGDWIEGQRAEPRPSDTHALRQPHASENLTPSNDQRIPSADNVIRLSDFRARPSPPSDRRD